MDVGGDMPEAFRFNGMALMNGVGQHGVCLAWACICGDLDCTVCCGLVCERWFLGVVNCGQAIYIKSKAKQGQSQQASPRLSSVAPWAIMVDEENNRRSSAARIPGLRGLMSALDPAQRAMLQQFWRGVRENFDQLDQQVRELQEHPPACPSLGRPSPLHLRDGGRPEVPVCPCPGDSRPPSS